METNTSNKIKSEAIQLNILLMEYYKQDKESPLYKHILKIYQLCDEVESNERRLKTIKDLLK